MYYSSRDPRHALFLLTPQVLYIIKQRFVSPEDTLRLGFKCNGFKQ